MIPKGYFDKGLFLSELEGVSSDKDSLYYQVAEELFNKNNINEKILKVSPDKIDLDFDSFIIETEKYIYCIKLSFDENSFFLKNESDFLKNNNNSSLPEYVCSGVHQVGENIRYLIYKIDHGIPIMDLSRSFIYEKRWMFFQCLNLLMECKSNTSFIDYADFVFEHFDISKSIPEISEQRIYPAHNKEDIDFISKTIKEYFYSSFDFSVFECDAFCHGNISISDISTNGMLFKFDNFNSSFHGNPFLDIAFTCFNFNFSKLMFNNMVKTFCDIHDLNYDGSKPFFRSCLRAACCIFLYRKFNEFLIEQCVYENKRQDKIVDLLQGFNSLDWCFKLLPFYDEIKEKFETIYSSPTKII